MQLLNKQLEAAARGVGLALHQAVARLCWERWFIDWSLTRDVKDYKIKKLHMDLFYFAKSVQLDLSHTKYMGGELMSVPEGGVPLPSDYEDEVKKQVAEVSKFSGTVTKQVTKDYRNERIKWEQDKVKALYEICEDIMELLELYNDIINPEDQEQDDEAEDQEQPGDDQDFEFYLMNLGTLWALVSFFMESIPSLLEIAYSHGSMLRPSPEQEAEINKARALKNNMDFSLDFHIPVNQDTQEVQIEKAKKEGMVTGVVLAPGNEDERDHHGHWMTEESIRKASVHYMEKHQVLGYQHKYFAKKQGVKNPNARLIYNYIVEEEKGKEINGVHVPKGTWVQTWKILNPKWKRKIEKGDLTGFSVGGYATIKPDTKKEDAEES